MPKVNEREIGPCAGVTVSEKVSRELGIPKMGEVCNDRMPMRIQGFDGRWRCLACNKIHTEIVYASTNPPPEVAARVGYGQPIVPEED